VKAIVFDRYGPPEVLRHTEIPDPVPAEGEVLVRVKAVSLNKADLIMMRGEPTLMRLAFGLRAPRVKILGRAIAGVVEALGPNTDGFKEGDEVLAEVDQRGFAELVATPAKFLVAIPPGVGFERAAALPVAATTALQGLRVGRVADGHRVLVNGASGGVGTFLVQLAKALGASEVTGVCSARNAETVASIGADRVVDYSREDFTRTESGYDAVLDVVSNHPLGATRRVLRPGGVYVACGGRSDNFSGPMPRLLKMAVTSPFVKQRLRNLLALRNGDDLAFVAALVAEGKVEPVIERTGTLADIPEEIRRLETEHARGKVVLTV